MGVYSVSADKVVNVLYGVCNVWVNSVVFMCLCYLSVPKSFNSSRWKNCYNPDLIFAVENIANMCEKSIMEPLPHTQHHDGTRSFIYAGDLCIK